MRLILFYVSLLLLFQMLSLATDRREHQSFNLVCRVFARVTLTDYRSLFNHCDNICGSYNIFAMFAVVEMSMNPIIPIHLQKFVFHLIQTEKYESTFLVQNRTPAAAGVKVAVKSQTLLTYESKASVNSGLNLMLSFEINHKHWKMSKYIENKIKQLSS